MEAARSARPTPAARERLGVALAARLGATALGGPSGMAAAHVPSPSPVATLSVTASPVVGAGTTLSLAKAALIGMALAAIPARAITVAPEHGTDSTEEPHAHAVHMHDAPTATRVVAPRADTQFTPENPPRQPQDHGRPSWTRFPHR